MSARREIFDSGYGLKVAASVSETESGVIVFQDLNKGDHLFSLRCESIARLEPERDPFEDTSQAERVFLENKRRIYREALSEILHLYFATWIMGESRGREMARAEIRDALGILPAPKTPREAGRV